MDLQVPKGVDWIQLTQVRVYWRFVGNRGSILGGKFLTSWATISFSRSIFSCATGGNRIHYIQQSNRSPLRQFCEWM